MLLAYCDLCWFVSSRDDILKLQEYEPRDYLVSRTNKIKNKKRERERGQETMGAADHGLYRRLWAVRACSARWRVLIQSWAMPPTTGDIQIKQGGEPIQYNQPWRFDWENTLILVAASHC
jgi:hypothetical protein